MNSVKGRISSGRGAHEFDLVRIGGDQLLRERCAAAESEVASPKSGRFTKPPQFIYMPTASPVSGSMGTCGEKAWNSGGSPGGAFDGLERAPREADHAEVVMPCEFFSGRPLASLSS